MRTRYQALIHYLVNQWEASDCFKSPRQGCTLGQLEKLMQAQGVSRLPALYQEFMLNFGFESGGLQGGGKFTYQHVLSFKAQWGLKIIPSDSFIFVSELGLFALYFLTNNEIDDPMIYYVGEQLEEDESFGISEFKILSKYITDWFEDDLSICN